MDRPRPSPIVILLLSILAVLVALILAPVRLASLFQHIAKRPFSESAVQRITPRMSASAKTPVYFLSHGGPPTMYDEQHPVFPKLQEIGREITQQVKPKAVVVFSAHWQGEKDVIEVNTAESQGLIYDYYGFPAHYYKETYPNKGSPALAEKIISLLGAAGIKTESSRRGLDHGVFVPFKVAFDPKTNPLNVPIVQVSLFDSEDPHQHYLLGKALESLRSEGILIIVSGMAVHNLRDLGRTMGNPMPQAYAKSFDDALKVAVESPVAEREEKMAGILVRPDARKAHPTFEHLLPVHVGAGAAGSDLGKQLWTKPEGSMSWAQYRFGSVSTVVA